MNKLDAIYIFLLASLLIVWNFRRGDEHYVNFVQTVGFNTEPQLPEMKRSLAVSDGEADEDESSEISDESNSQDMDENISENDEEADKAKKEEVERETKQFIEIEKQLENQLKNDAEEQIVLNAKLAYLRQHFKKGVHNVIKEQIAKEDKETEGSALQDIEEFEKELEKLERIWTRDVDDIHRIRSGKFLETDTEELKLLAQQHMVWEANEVSKMMAQAKAETSDTLTGKREENPAWEWKSKHEKEQKLLQEKLLREEQLKAEARAKVGSEYLNRIKEVERMVSESWKNKREVIVLGEKSYIGRDINAYNSVFMKIGFVVRRKKPNPTNGESYMPGKLMASGSWSVLLCLALNTAHCFTDNSMAMTRRDQKMNRLQGLRAVLWDKHNFCRTLSDATKSQSEFTNYTFKCWLFPKEHKSALAYAKEHPGQSYIVKPLTMGGGMGISVVDGEKGLHRVRLKTHIVQTYLANPHLINGRKWDMRTYCLVTSSYPIRVYFYNRGIVRFASKAYDPNAKKGGNKRAFLTNTSVNKHSKKGNLTDITWSFQNLQQYFEGRGISYDQLLHKMEIAISTVFLSAEQAWKRYFDEQRRPSNAIRYCANCYQVMGVDLIVDSALHPRVIEVNGQPSMQLSKDAKDHYSQTKRMMITDLVNMIFNKEEFAPMLDSELQKVSNKSVLTKLEQSDWEYLVDYRKEVANLGGWRQVYPSAVHTDYHTRFLQLQQPSAQRESLHKLLVELEVLRNNLKEK